MELGDLSNYGVAAIFIFGYWKLYTDTRKDNADNKKESGEREEKLMKHLDRQADTMTEISGTLQTLDNRICSLESRIKGKKKVSIE